MTRQKPPKLTLIFDASTLITLNELGLIPLLSQLASQHEIIIPEKVRQELKTTKLQLPRTEPKIKQTDLPPHLSSALEGLGEGEKEAITIAYLLAAKGVNCTVVTDDKKARKTCKKLKVKATGTLGIIEHLKISRIITKKEALKALAKIPQTSLYITPDITEKAEQKIQSQQT